MNDSNKKVKRAVIAYLLTISIVFIISMLLEDINYDLAMFFLVFLIFGGFVGFIILMCYISKIRADSSLLFNYRNIIKTYDKRAICDINVLFDLLKIALEEKLLTNKNYAIQMYMLVYAYDGELYSIGYERDEDIRFFYLHDNDYMIFDSLEQLSSNIKLNHNVTVLREFQNNNLNGKFVPTISGIAVSAFIDSLSLNDGNVIETNINDNYILKKYLVSKDNNNFNYNMSEKLIDLMPKNTK